MNPTRPLAFLDTAALVSLGLVLLAAASWTRLAFPFPGGAMIDPGHAVAVALADDTGLDVFDDPVSDQDAPADTLSERH